MKPRFSFLTLLLVLTLSAGTAAASERAGNNSLSNKEASEGWRLLFDGRTFEGWQGMKGSPFPTQSWTVQDGMICTLDRRSGGDIITTAKYEDFVLELEWKITPQGNSGVKYMVQQEWLNPGFQPDYPEERKLQQWRSAVGFEYQIIDDERYRGREGWETSGTGALYLLAAPRSKKLNPPGEWNHTRIVVQDKHLEHWLNGQKILESDLDSPEFIAQIQKTKFHAVPGYGIKAAGHISLQHHGSPACFKNLKIRTLSVH